MTEFAEWLKKSREAKNFSQAELASRLGMHPRSISRMETGEGTPTKNNLRRIAEYFGVDPDGLVRAALEGGDVPEVKAEQTEGLSLDFYAEQMLRKVADKAGMTPAAWVRGMLEWLEEESVPFREYVLLRIARPREPLHAKKAAGKPLSGSNPSSQSAERGSGSLAPLDTPLT